MLVDTARYGVIAGRDGYMAKIKTIDAKITPENRILVGLYDATSQTEHTATALAKVARVYDRVFADKEGKRRRKKEEEEVK
jgi:hypothetical protein